MCSYCIHFGHPLAIPLCRDDKINFFQLSPTPFHEIAWLVTRLASYLTRVIARLLEDGFALFG